MRKPEERIFQHAAGLLGLDPGECVFVDDIEVNVAAAEAVGMTASCTPIRRRRWPASADSSAFH